MHTAYLTLSIVLIGYLSFSAVADFIGHKQVLLNMARVGVPESWLYPLGALKSAAVVGILVGVAVPLFETTAPALVLSAKLIGTSAVAGVILFFIGAIVTHVRARFYSFAFPTSFLVLAIAVMTLGLLSSALG
ncbi:MAG: DoxX family protein [Chloroflexi bacterium]|nr:DoxX family protein [Chloroflexota bacterium]